MALSIAELTTRLADSGVMTVADVASFVGGLSGDAKPTDGEQLAKRLVKDKKISAYQAQVVYSGKGKSLTMGSYFVLDKLGQGGMGMVVKAEHRMMKRLVAIKVLSPAVTKTKEAQQRFQREVEAAARLTHPNIVGAFDAGQENGSPFLVMEYVPGDDLSAIVKKKGPLSVEQAIDCIIQAARGLEFAHKRGVIHRDIKPANLLLDTSGVVKILDMGLARIDAADVATQADLTGTGAVMGTVDYMAPEQALSTKHADAKSDIYSLGISLWYLLTAKATYEGDSLMARLLAHRDQPIPSLRTARDGVSEQLEAVFRRMVAKKPAERYQTATEVIADLQACRTGGTVSAMVVVEEESSTDGDFQSFLKGMAEVTKTHPGAKAQRSLTGTRTQTLSNPELEDVGEETQARVGFSDTLQRRRQGAGSQRPSPALWQDRRVQIGGGAAAVLLLLAVIFLIQTPHGTLRVEILDPQVEVTVVGTKVTLKEANTEPVSLQAGDKKLLVTRGDLSFETESFTLKKGTETKVKVDLVEETLIATSGGKVLGEKSVGRKSLTTSTTGAKERGSNGGDSTSSSVTMDAVSLGQPGQFSLKFARDEYVEMPPQPNPSSTECTCEMWLTTNSSTQGRSAFLLWNSPYCGLTIAPDGTFIFYTHHGHALSPPLYKQNQRIHLAGVNDTKRRVLYLNGKLIATSPDAGVAKPQGELEPMFIGKGHFDGWIDAVHISRVARYSAEFTPPATFTPDENSIALYRFDEGQGDMLKDSSGNKLHGKIVGAKWVKNEGASTPSPQPTGEAIDLLAKVELPRDAWMGEWTREGSTLISPGGGKPGRIMVRYPPPPEYELLAVVERMSGVDGLSLGVVVDGRSAGVCFDSFVPQISGINLIDGKWANDNETTFREPVLTDRQPHTIRVAVSKRSIRASVDGREIVRWEGDPARLSNNEQIPDRKNLWFASAYHQFKFHKLELRPLNASPVTSQSGTAARNVVYLDDLNETSWKDGFMRLGKHNLEYNGWKYKWRGEEPTHALSTHPRPDMTATVTYQLDRNYASLSATTGIADEATKGSTNPVTFRVVGDGRELWKSRPLQQPTEEESFTVSVAGVHELKLEVSCGNDNYAAHAIWFEPRLTRPETNVVYLDDLTEKSYVGFNQLGKLGADIDPNRPKRSLDGVVPAHGLTMHPPLKPPLTAVAVYDLSGKYTRFDGIVARPDGTMRGNQTFVHVVGDGQLLWKSPALFRLNPQETFDINVTGVQELTLKVEATYDSNEAHILWVDPRLTLAIAPASRAGGQGPPPAKAPFDAKQARAHQEAWAKHLGVSVEYTNRIGMKFVLIPPGEFLMGSTEAEMEAALKDAPGDPVFRAKSPQHTVILSRPFFLGVHEVTQTDYEQVMGTKPSHFAPQGIRKEAVVGLDTATHSVDYVSWNDAAEFCAKLSQQEGYKPFYTRDGEVVEPLEGTGYQLPTEAEWEFACRAGTTTKYWTGDRNEDLAKAGWYRDNAGGRTHRVGELKANPFGLYDVHGNAQEWVRDGWQRADHNYGAYDEKTVIDPYRPFAGCSDRIHRGGFWFQMASGCGSANRHPWITAEKNSHFGFRMSLTVEAVRQVSGVATAAPGTPIGSDLAMARRLTSSDFEWTPPENLGPDVNSQYFDEHPELTSDGLKLWFSGGGELWVSSRTSLEAPFGKRNSAGSQVNDGASWDSEPTLSADRGTLVFCSDRGTNKQDQNLWMSTRSKQNGVFGKPIRLGDEINTPHADICPSLSADGLTLIFASIRPGGQGDFDLYQATRTSTSAEFGNVTNLGPTINSSSRDSGAHLSTDGLVLLFESDRTGGEGKNDLYLCTRPTKNAPFGKPVSLGATINTPDAEHAPCLSSDGQTLMFYSDRPGGQGEADIWMSRRVPVSK